MFLHILILRVHKSGIGLCCSNDIKPNIWIFMLTGYSYMALGTLHVNGKMAAILTYYTRDILFDNMGDIHSVLTF